MGQAVSVRRTLASLTPEDGDGGGRPITHGYGRRWLARISGRTLRTVRAAARAGVDFGDPVQAVAWALEQRGAPELAEAVRATFAQNAASRHQ
jgi:hypothetical protein